MRGPPNKGAGTDTDTHHTDSRLLDLAPQELGPFGFNSPSRSRIPRGG
jgi:hypothetical protein